MNECLLCELIQVLCARDTSWRLTYMALWLAYWDHFGDNHYLLAIIALIKWYRGMCSTHIEAYGLHYTECLQNMLWVVTAFFNCDRTAWDIKIASSSLVIVADLELTNIFEDFWHWTYFSVSTTILYCDVSTLSTCATIL